MNSKQLSYQAHGSYIPEKGHPQEGSQLNKEKKGVIQIQPYDSAKQRSVTLLNRQNLARGIKIAFHSVALAMFQAGATIKRIFNSAKKADYQFKADLYEAVHISHRKDKMGMIWA